ncbi:Eukaryotic translation initiation factor 3 subunit C [Bienertia sinuspersici]
MDELLQGSSTVTTNSTAALDSDGDGDGDGDDGDGDGMDVDSELPKASKVSSKLQFKMHLSRNIILEICKQTQMHLLVSMCKCVPCPTRKDT